jgi:hypothetical protein
MMDDWNGQEEDSQTGTTDSSEEYFDIGVLTRDY